LFTSQLLPQERAAGKTPAEVH